MRSSVLTLSGDWCIAFVDMIARHLRLQALPARLHPVKTSCWATSRPITSSLENRAAPTSLSSPPPPPPPPATPSFPCVDAHAVRESRILSQFASTRDPDSGPEPAYCTPDPGSYKTYSHKSPLPLTYAPPLPSFKIAYETWGTLTPQKENVILLHTGLSASSHAASTDLNPDEGWWERFIGPGKALDTNQYFVICTNVLGGCYGSTGPSSIELATGRHYGTRFPVLSIFDMVRAQFCLLDHLGINKLYASVGSSMGGMQSLAAGFLYPDRVGNIVTVSGTARTSPSSIAMRFAQRSGEPSRSILFRKY